MKRNPVGWFEIYVEDLDRAKKFYEAVLGLELTGLGPPSAELEMLAFPMEPGAGGASGAVVKSAGSRPTGNGTLVYFSCEDCATEGARVKGAGGQIKKPKFSIGPYGFIVLALDTDGNVFGLHSMK